VQFVEPELQPYYVPSSAAEALTEVAAGLLVCYRHNYNSLINLSAFKDVAVMDSPYPAEWLSKNKIILLPTIAQPIVIAYNVLLNDTLVSLLTRIITPFTLPQN